MKIILVSGKAEHGKDTFAELLKNRMVIDGKKVLITHYADLLKYICKTFFDWNGVKDTRGRDLLQYVGTDIIRKKKPEMWVGFIAEILTMFYGEWDYIIIPDTRFKNEIKIMQEKFQNDVITVRVIRTNFITTLSLEQQRHPSECDLDEWKFDHFIKASNIQTLRDKTSMFYRALKHLEI